MGLHPGRPVNGRSIWCSHKNRTGIKPNHFQDQSFSLGCQPGRCVGTPRFSGLVRKYGEKNACSKHWWKHQQRRSIPTNYIIQNKYKVAMSLIFLVFFFFLSFFFFFFPGYFWGPIEFGFCLRPSLSFFVEDYLSHFFPKHIFLFDVQYPRKCLACLLYTSPSPRD